ncbi:hypothetical protein PS15m_011958 [Mucor circinelloides]
MSGQVALEKRLNQELMESQSQFLVETENRLNEINQQLGKLAETRNHLDLVHLEQEEDLQILLDALSLSDDEFEEEEREKEEEYE